jgi:hypothetical protein
MRMTTVSSGLMTTHALISGAPCALVEDMNGTWKPSDRPTVADPAKNERRSSLGI